MKSSEIRLHYGDQVIAGFIPQEWIDEGRFLPLLLPPKNRVIAEPRAALKRALEQPIGASPAFGELVKSRTRGGDISILVDDYTRPNDHTRLLLPLLRSILEEDYAVGPDRIKVIICAGTHRPPTDAEMEKILGDEAHAGLRIVVHDCEGDLHTVGELEGVPVKFNREAFDSDIIIPLTDIDNHYFAGVAGGPKAFCPGIAGKEIITWEHLHMFSDTGFADDVALGILEGNPVYECKKRIVRLALDALEKKGVSVYCTAAIIDPEGDLVYLEGGEIFTVHRAAAEKLKDVWTVRISERAEVVVAGASTCGLNLYQAGKAIHAAFHAVREGGFIMTAAPCPDSFGNDEYKGLMQLASDVLGKYPDGASGMEEAKLAVLDVVRKNFKIGKQKAVDFFRILEFVGWGHLHMIQDGLSEEDRRILPFVFWGREGSPAAERLEEWVRRHAAGKTIAVIDNPGYLVKEKI